MQDQQVFVAADQEIVVVGLQQGKKNVVFGIAAGRIDRRQAVTIHSEAKRVTPDNHNKCSARFPIQIVIELFAIKNPLQLGQSFKAGAQVKGFQR